MVARARLRFAALFSVLASFFLGFFHHPHKAMAEDVVEQEIRQPGSAKDKNQPIGAYAFRTTPGSEREKNQPAAAAGWITPAGKLDSSQPVDAAANLQRMTMGGVMSMPIDKVFVKDGERDQFVNWVRSMGIEQPTFEDAVFFRLETVMQRLDKMENK